MLANAFLAVMRATAANAATADTGGRWARRSGRAATTHRRRDPSAVGRAGVAAGRGSRCRAGLVRLAAASPSPRSSLPLATTPTTPKSTAV